MGHFVFVPDLKQTVRYFFACSASWLMFSFTTFSERAEGKNFLLNLLHLCLSVDLSDDRFTPFSTLSILLWHIPQSEKKPKLSSVILDGFYFDLSLAFSAKNSWLLPCGQNDDSRFRRSKISCLYIVMSCSHDDGMSFSFSSVLRLCK